MTQLQMPFRQETWLLWTEAGHISENKNLYLLHDAKQPAASQIPSYSPGEIKCNVNTEKKKESRCNDKITALNYCLIQ
jgi:hypothetical protein